MRAGKVCDGMSARTNYYYRRMNLIQEAKSKPCTDCKVEYPLCVMEFDHRDPSEKVFALSQFAAHGYDAIKAELAKCDVVCSNCHRIRTHGTGKQITVTVFGPDA